MHDIFLIEQLAKMACSILNLKSYLSYLNAEDEISVSVSSVFEIYSSMSVDGVRPSQNCNLTVAHL